MALLVFNGEINDCSFEIKQLPFAAENPVIVLELESLGIPQEKKHPGTGYSFSHIA
jgi:hypothetical protein